MLPQHIHIVIVGRRTGYTEKVEQFIKDNGLGERVHIISNVPFNDLPAFYQSAEIFVYPSRFEGFGIPIIEALYSGIPVVAATGSCLEEAGGPDSIYVSRMISPDWLMHLNKYIQIPIKGRTWWRKDGNSRNGSLRNNNRKKLLTSTRN